MGILSFSFFDPHSAQQNDQFHTLQKAVSPLIYEPFYLKHKLLWQFCLLLGWEKAFSYLTRCRTIQFSCNIHLIFKSISWNVGAMRIRSEIIHVEWSWDSRHLVQFHSVQSLSRVQHFATPWTAALQASLSITNSQSYLKLMSIKLIMPSNHLILCHPPFLPPSILPRIRVFSNESVLRIRWPKDWSFSFNISPSNEYSGLISFRMDWLILLAVQGTLKNLLQHNSSKASTLWHSAFFIVQLSHS